VGASDKSDVMGSFSSRGPTFGYEIKPEVTAPGVNINSCFLGGGYVVYSGTSMATPHVAGAVALLKQLHPDWSPEMMKDALMEGAKDLGEDCFSQGSGRIDVYKSATLKGIITPGSVNLGMCRVNQDMWSKVDTLQIRNISNEPQSYFLTFEQALPVGVNLSIYPNQVSLGTGQTQDLVFTISVDNTIITDPPDVSHPFSGKIIAQSATDTLKVPFSFVRALPYQEGWPFVGLISNVNIDQSLVAGNLDLSDTQEELVLCMYDNVYAWNHDGTLMTGWPIRPENVPNFRGASMAVQDGIGMVAFGGGESPYTAEKAYVRLQDGSSVNGWPKLTNWIVHSPVWADIDGDGIMEVVAVAPGGNTESGTIYVWNIDGSDIPGFPVEVGDWISKHAVGDVNNDGANEIVAVSNRKIHLISSSGAILWEQPASGSPSLADLNGDGNLEILVSTSQSLYSWDSDGNVLWPRKDLSGWDLSPVAIGDLDGDGSLELVACISIWIYVWDKNGNIKPGWPVSIPDVNWTWTTVDDGLGPAIGDIDGDGKEEIVANAWNMNSGWNIYALHPDGSVVDGFPYVELNGFDATSTPVITDLDKDGKVEICSYGQSHNDPYYTHLRVVVYDLETPYDSSRMDWPMLRHDPRRTGCFKEAGAVGVADEPGKGEIPSEFGLSQNYPNPFNQNTKIRFTLPQPGFVSLNVYDLLGRKVRTLVSENLTPGYKSVLWDGKNDSGKEVSSGIYFYQLKIGDFSEAKKLVLLK
jgi:hypothetical protein